MENGKLFTELAEPGVEETSTDHQQNSYASFFNNEEYADLKLYLGPSKLMIHAHRLVLGTKSSYFKSALRSGMQESTTGEFFLQGNEYALYRVFQFFYTGDYDQWELNLEIFVDDRPDCIHARVFQLAKYFGSEHLAKVAYEKLSNDYKSGFDSEALLGCVNEIYDGNSPGFEPNPYSSDNLKSIVVDEVAAHIKQLQNDDDLEDLIRQRGEFAVDLIKKLATLQAPQPDPFAQTSFASMRGVGSGIRGGAHGTRY